MTQNLLITGLIVFIFCTYAGAILWNLRHRHEWTLYYQSWATYAFFGGHVTVYYWKCETCDARREERRTGLLPAEVEHLVTTILKDEIAKATARIQERAGDA